MRWCGAGRRDDVLLDHHGAHVVGPEAERDLADLHSLRHPRRLDVRDIVEVDPRYGLREQVVERGRPAVLGHEIVEAVAVALERPGDEGPEAARLVLELADLPHVLDPLLERLDVPVHHRRRRRHPEPVGLAHDVEPFLRLRLLRRDDRANSIHEDFRAATGDRVEPGVAQARERLRGRELRAPRDVLDLGRRERVEVDRVALLDRAEEILVVVDPEVGVVATLHEQPGAAERERLLDLLVDHGLGQQIALAHVAWPAVERAEVAVRDADVRVVEVPVDDERHHGRVGQPVPDLVCRAPDRDQVARAEQRDRVLVRDALAVEGLLQHRIDLCA
jgi:hypothetical protein